MSTGVSWNVSLAVTFMFIDFLFVKWWRAYPNTRLLTSYHRLHSLTRLKFFSVLVSSFPWQSCCICWLRGLWRLESLSPPSPLPLHGHLLGYILTCCRKIILCDFNPASPLTPTPHTSSMYLATAHRGNIITSCLPWETILQLQWSQWRLYKYNMHLPYTEQQHEMDILEEILNHILTQVNMSY